MSMEEQPTEEQMSEMQEAQMLRDVEYQAAQSAAFNPPEPGARTDNFATTKFLEEVDMPNELYAFGAKFWAAISKDIKLSNMTEDNIKLLMLMFESSKQRFLMSIPEKDFTFDIYFHLEQLRMILYTRLTSARGGFERRQLSSSTKNVTIGNDGKQGSSGGGFLRRLQGGFSR